MNSIIRREHDQLVVFGQLQALVTPGVELNPTVRRSFLPSMPNTDRDLAPRVGNPLQIGKGIFAAARLIVWDMGEYFRNAGAGNANAGVDPRSTARSTSSADMGFCTRWRQSPSKRASSNDMSTSR